jgi:hypothetical protein
MGSSLQLRVIALTLAAAVAGCAGQSSRIGEYLTGFQTAPSEAQAVSLPLTVGLFIALPENELSYPTTPSKDTLAKIAFRIQKELQESSRITVAHIAPPIIVPATGIGTLSLERVREAMRGRGVDKVIVIVATSQPARKAHYGILEDQLFARMDAALVDLTTGHVLAADSGQDDYVLAQSYFFNAFSYPRLYYRTFTFAGPFTVVEGDPYKALGEAAFSGAADQIGMKLRQRLDAQRPGSAL